MPTWYVMFAPDLVTVTAPNAGVALDYGQQVHAARVASGQLEMRIYDEDREYWHNKETPTHGRQEEANEEAPALADGKGN